MDSFSIVEAKGFYQFKIDHLKTKNMSVGKNITSPKFRVGPHDWVIYYYPQGSSKDNTGKYVSIYLELKGKSTDVAATFGFSLMDKNGNISEISKSRPHIFESQGSSWGHSRFLDRTNLDEIFVKDGYIVLLVSIIVNDIESCKQAAVKNTNLNDPLRKCIQTYRDENKHTDVTFDVDGKKFVAHRLILAAHSPVFEAEFFGSMAESELKCIQIKEMIPSIFKAMFDFMYNGSLPANEKLIDDELMSPVCFLENLLAAADCYAVEQLKTICQQRLHNSISMETVLSLLELAERYGCNELKKDCLLFMVGKNNWAFNREYIKLMHDYPSLIDEFEKMAVK